jgi:hypothetical protein
LLLFPLFLCIILDIEWTRSLSADLNKAFLYWCFVLQERARLCRNKTVYRRLYRISLFIYSLSTSTRRHGNFAGVHTLLRIILSSNSAVLINIITGVSPPHFDFFCVLCSVSMLRNFLTMWHEYNNIPFWISTTNVFSKSKIFKFLKRDCGTIPVAEIINGKIEIFSKHFS